jgi:hypothetical protein
MKTKILKLIAILLLLAGSFYSCENNSMQEQEFIQEQKLTPLTLAKGVLSDGIKNLAGKNMVVTTKSEWDNLRTTMNLISTEVDFNTYQVIAVIDDIHGNGGWTVDITDITEYADKIVVTYTNLETGNATSATTQPFHIVKIPVSNKRILFQQEKGNNDENNVSTERICERAYFDFTIPLKGVSCLFVDSVPADLKDNMYANYIIYDKKQDLATLFAYYSYPLVPYREAFYCGFICNFPDFAKEWEIPSEGKQIYYEGEFHTAIMYGVSFKGGDIVLTTFK